MRPLADLTPLRDSPAFRRLWIGSSISSVGSQFSVFAAMYAVWRLTHSTVLVGTIGLVTGLPLLVIALAGTAFIDGVDRARLARAVAACQALTTVALAVAAYAGSVAGIMVLTAVNASLGGLGGPARRALIPHVVTRSQLGAAFALNSSSFQISMLIGPALAGVVAGSVGVATCFLIDAGTFLAALIGLRGLAATPSTGRHGIGYRAALEGLRFARVTPVVRAALLSDLSATLLAMPIALFPAINQQRFGGDPETLGLFTTALAVGGVLGSVLSGTITRRTRPGLVMTVCALTWGTSLALIGLIHSLPVLFGALAMAGIADTWSVVSRATIIQSCTPDSLRGRISTLEQVVGVGGPDLGNFRAGAVAALTGPGMAMTIGGLSCVLASLVILGKVPALRRYEPAEQPA